MIALALKAWLLNLIKRKVRKAMFKKLLNAGKGKLTYASVGVLVAGLVAQLFGIDIAPAEVDALVTAAATIGAIYGRYRATKAA